MAEKKYGSFEEYKKSLDSKIMTYKVYSDRLHGEHELAILSTKKKYGWNLEGDKIKNFAEDLVTEYQKHISELSKIDKNNKTFDKNSYDSLFEKHTGLNKRMINKLVKEAETQEEIYHHISNKSKEANQSLIEERLDLLTEEFINVKHPETIEYAIKYIGVEKEIVERIKKMPEELKNILKKYILENQLKVPVKLNKKK